MSLAATLQKTATRALKSYGAKGTLTHTASVTYDPATGTTTVGVTTITPVSALLDAPSLKTLGFRFGDGLVQAGDFAATVSGIVPVPGDALTVLSGPYAGPYTIKDVRPEFAGPDVVMCQCLVRR